MQALWQCAGPCFNGRVSATSMWWRTGPGFNARSGGLEWAGEGTSFSEGRAQRGWWVWRQGWWTWWSWVGLQGLQCDNMSEGVGWG
jgi:hypothetical protein